MDIRNLADDIQKWIREKVEEAGAKGVVFGLSGGIDSAVIAGLSKKIYPSTSLGIIMPCNSNYKDEEDAILVAEKLSLSTTKVDLTSTYNMLVDQIDTSENNELALSNIKPRLRMTTLYYYAQINNYLVLGSTNKSEFYTGYFTKHGDSSVDLLPLADLVKEEIYLLAEYLDIPKEIILKAPTAGLTDEQTDEDELGMKYKDLDNYIKTGVGDKDLVEKIEKLKFKNEHKRNYPPIYKQI